MRNAREELNWAQSMARNSLGNLTSTANTVDQLGEKLPEHAERLASISAQLWATTEITRDIEHALAEIHSEVRSAT